MAKRISPESLLWLYTATFLLHIAEEGFAGEGFYRWISGVTGREMPRTTFFLLNAIFFGAMVLAILVFPAGRSPWLTSILGTITAGNALGHIVGSAFSRAYSPGVVTGTLLWLPLGSFALINLAGTAPREFIEGLFTGVSLSIMVVVLAYLATSREPGSEESFTDQR